jgi:hypothetical protein
MNDIAVPVPEHLDFNMARLDDGALEEQSAVSERCLRFGSRSLEGGR